MKNFLAALIIFLSHSLISAERDVRDGWCDSMQGIAEFRTKDGTYVDWWAVLSSSGEIAAWGVENDEDGSRSATLLRVDLR